MWVPTFSQTQCSQEYPEYSCSRPVTPHSDVVEAELCQTLIKVSVKELTKDFSGNFSQRVRERRQAKIFEFRDHLQIPPKKRPFDVENDQQQSIPLKRRNIDLVHIQADHQRVNTQPVKAWATKILLPLRNNQEIHNYFRSQLGYSLPPEEDLSMMSCSAILREFRSLCHIISCADNAIPQAIKEGRFSSLHLIPYHVLKNQESCQAWINDHAEAVKRACDHLRNSVMENCLS